MDIVGAFYVVDKLESSHEDEIPELIERTDDARKIFDFHLEEYRAGKAEILLFEEEIINFERFGLIGVVAAYAFILGGEFNGGLLI